MIDTEQLVNVCSQDPYINIRGNEIVIDGTFTVNELITIGKILEPVRYFYRYTAWKDGIYNCFRCGTFTIPDGESPWEHVVSDINEKYPDNTSWDITALNRI